MEIDLNAEFESSLSKYSTDLRLKKIAENVIFTKEQRLTAIKLLLQLARNNRNIE